jgi:hypothetical protein
MTNISPIERLEAALSDVSGVYVDASEDAEIYFFNLANDIRRHVCEPFQVSAVVAPPGFPDAKDGSVISGLCVARNAGYWLVYQPEQDRFCCFWGTSQEALSAPGIFGSPLYCWSA